MDYRLVKKDEIAGLKGIDRRETIENVYRMTGDGLVLEKQPQVADWSAGRYDEVIAELGDLHDAGGTIIGAFMNGLLVGIVSLEQKFMGRHGDQLQVTMLQVSRPHRRTGVGGTLLELVKIEASRLGAKKLYISGSRSENTVHFYLAHGCAPASDVDERLFEMEPVDIHLELELAGPE